MPNSEQLTKTKEDAIGMGCLMAGLLLVLALFWIYAQVRNRSNCVELPNGLLIAGAPNPRPHNFRGGTIYILKKPDGTVIIPEPSQRLIFTETTVFGRAGPTVADENFYKFAYHKDIGLVLKNKRAEIYNRIVKEAGTKIWLNEREHPISSHFAYSDGSRNSKYWRTDCPANVFP